MLYVAPMATVLEGLYLPVRIREELRRPAGLARPGTLLDQVD